jgi:M6 family metalloprotease-like protein
MPFPPTLADFGHASLTIGGRLAAGGRRLLVVLVDYSENPPISVAHANQYYELLAFGDPAPPFSTDSPVNPASLREYFRENSYGRFWFDSVGLVGPLNMGALGPDPGPVARCTAIMQSVALTSPESFFASDTDADHVVAQNEMSVVLVENFPGAQPDISGHNPVQATIQVGPITVALTVNVILAGVGPYTPFCQIAHELSHATVGTVDMYNSGKGNYGMTLMSGYSFTSNDQYSVHLDMWHKFALGWAEPRRFRLSEAGSAEIWEGPDGAILLWDDARGATEYFLVERRRPDAPGQRFDSGFVGDGAVIWRVQQQMAGGVVTLAPPNLSAGGSGAWAPGTQTPYLVWTNGDQTTASISVADPGDGRLQVTWGDEVTHTSASRHHLLLHGGNGTDGVGGLTDRGVFYGITTNGDLEWNCYNGNGAQIGDPGSGQNWHPNTGNLIGRGWGQMLHVAGCGNGTVLAVNANGNLHWYSYSGNGESDVTGAAGWDANSGNVIGNGWQNFLHVFAIPSSGASGSMIHVFAVDPDGRLLWYGYTGNGEHDPSGHKGWVHNSGNQVGTGWTGFRHIHASSNVIFAIKNDGTLYWYCYEGHGESDPTGGKGWRLNSGNPVGTGWQSMQHVFGGVSDTPGFGHIVMGVDVDGYLRWYRYTGQGESDISGAQGWDARSGSRVGARW